MKRALAESERDVLTGLVSTAGARAWLDAAGRDGFVQAMLVSLQRLQTVNLAYGKTGGDLALVEVAQRLSDFAWEELGPDALVARTGGADFILASAAPLPRARWHWLAEALGRAISRPMLVEGEAIRLQPRTALIRGLSGEPGADLLDRLDQASLELQRSPVRRILWADGSHPARGQSAASLEADLIGALHREEIAVLFQPQFDVATGALCGAEALARWEHPKFGRIGAETLFAIAERGDLVTQMTEHVATLALDAACAWPDTMRLSLNVTPEDFALGRFAETMRRLIGETRFSARRLTLEITERTLISDFDDCAAAIEDLALDGVRVALDDFGTGFSNFRALKALPLDALKVDRSLVRDIARDRRDRAIVTAMIAMARALGMSVVAEGVETEAQLAILQEEGCDTFQGFLRAGPVSAKDMAALAEFA